MTAHYLRLKDNHPTMIKLAKLCDVADELGLNITYYGHRAMLRDSEWPGTLLYIDDIENDSISEFPFTTEYKLTYENPAWLEEQRIEDEKQTAKREEEERIQQ